MPLISGILSFFALAGYPESILTSLFSYVPLFYSIFSSTNIIEICIESFMFSLCESILWWSWILPSMKKLGISLIFNISSLIFFSIARSIIWTIALTLTGDLHGKVKNKYIVTKAVSILFLPLPWITVEFIWNKINEIIGTVFVYNAGYSLWWSKNMLYIASIVGIYGVSYILILSEMLVTLMANIKNKYLLFCLLLFIFLSYHFLFHYQSVHNYKKIKEKQIKICIANTYIPVEVRYKDRPEVFIAKHTFNIAKQCVKHKPNLIIWPETTIPWPLEEDDDMALTILNIINSTKADSVIGALFKTNISNLYYNSVFFIKPDGTIIFRYDKQIPLKGIESPLFENTFFRLHPSPYVITKGNFIPPINWYNESIGIFICNEILYPSYLLKTFLKTDCSFIVVLTNNGWINSKTALKRHLVAAMFRAAECGRYTVIASNCGFSGIICPDGIPHELSEPGIETVISGNISGIKEKTWYIKTGFIFPYIAVVFVIICFINNYFYKHRQWTGI